MRNLLLVLALLSVSGCSLSENLQTNVFGDLWKKYVTEKKTSPVINRIQEGLMDENESKFSKIDREINKIRGFLILGEEIEQAGSDEKSFREGLMKIDGENNEAIINKIKSINDIIDGNQGSEKSLLQEINKMKKSIKKVCLKQKESEKCDL